MNRKQRRKFQSELRKNKNIDSDVEEKINLLSKLGDECLTCQSPFDRTNIKMLSEWMVVVREDQNSVNLYCTDCWENAKNIISEIKAADNEPD